MNATKYFRSANIPLTDAQVTSLAKPLLEIVEQFYQSPENEEGFQKWLKDRANKLADSK